MLVSNILTLPAARNPFAAFLALGVLVCTVIFNYALFDTQSLPRDGPLLPTTIVVTVGAAISALVSLLHHIDGGIETPYDFDEKKPLHTYWLTSLIWYGWMVFLGLHIFGSY